jgi:glyoxalase/bleomycin resistance protein/dioxygenase superfamily protein
MSAWVTDIERVYSELQAKGVEFYSAPQLFEFDGYKAKAVYFLDPDGTTLEIDPDSGRLMSQFRAKPVFLTHASSLPPWRSRMQQLSCFAFSK